ncbi:hypothetical protein [Methylosinus sp. Ce-a6]|uniref:hypothetical protein n=1 Tax=Methylosinus sp. Ce-a6 TaxID=2172005 RepID=UPI00135822C6|nr:hypothetical protein [Methylosinus sp. Ce-a6]
MTKVCLIGDSHLGALKGGIEENNISEQGFEMTYFSLHTRHFPALRLRGRRIEGEADELRRELAMFSGGRDSIAIDDFDEFVIVGHGIYIGYLVDLYRDYCCDHMPGPARGRYLLSDSCFITTSQHILERSEAIGIGKMIRSITRKPITYVAAPNPGAGLAESEMPEVFPPFYPAVEFGDAEAVALLFREVCAALATAHDARVIAPIEDAAENGLFNRHEFCLLAERDTEGAPLSDRIGAMLHGNSRYGAMLARAVLDRGESP